MKINQKGFAVVEALLVLILITLISGVGFYVVSQNKDASNSSASTGESSKTESPESKEANEMEYITFTELGFKIKKSEAISDFTYKTESDNPNARYVSSAAHVALIDECLKGDPNAGTVTPRDKSFAAFSKHDGKYSAEAENYYAPGDIVKQFDTFYIAVGYPNGGPACINPDFKKDLPKSPPGAIEALKSALAAAEKL